MNNYLAAILSFLFSSAVMAQDAETPLEPNMTGVWIFLLICLLCFLWGGWYFWKTNKKPPSEREGDKF